MLILCICQGYSNRAKRGEDILLTSINTLLLLSLPHFMLLSIPTLATLIKKCWCWFSYSWICSTKDAGASHGKHSLIYFQVSSWVPWIFFFFLEQTISVNLNFCSMWKSLYLLFFCSMNFSNFVLWCYDFFF